jgi:transcriptional regulator with XRE-family HTH domain
MSTTSEPATSPRDLRLSRAMSRAGLARVAGINERTAARWEAGELVRDVTLARIARALGVPIERVTP